MDKQELLTPVCDRLTKIFQEKHGKTVPGTDVDLLETGLLDSLSLIDLLFEIEEIFSVRIPLESLDIEDIRTISSLASVVLDRITQK